MNFFESQLRRLFGDTEDARFIGRCCFIPADDGNLVKAEFVTQGVHEEYVALQMSVINRADGVIDKTLLRFGDYFSRNSRGQTPHIWCDSGKHEWYYREDRIMDAFIGIINRLRFAEEGIIAESIELTEKAILLKKRNNLQALESSQSMAELNAKLLMLEQLKSKGYLAQDVFESQSREINGQINEIKTKRIQSLSSALDVALEEFKTLQARLNEIDEPLDSFDSKLFEEVIKGMTVNNRDEMTFRLIGDLTFTVRL